MSQDETKDTFTKLNEAMPAEVCENHERILKERDEFKAKADEFHDKFLRTKAEMDNFHKRIERELENTRKFAVERILKELLPVIDSLDQGLHIAKNTPDAMEAMQEGMSLTLKMLLEVMQKFGVQVVEPNGEKYDPHLHEAMSIIAHPETDAGMVIQVIQKGYALHGRVIRPARVIVSK